MNNSQQPVYNGPIDPQYQQQMQEQWNMQGQIMEVTSWSQWSYVQYNAFYADQIIAFAPADYGHQNMGSTHQATQHQRGSENHSPSPNVQTPQNNPTVSAPTNPPQSLQTPPSTDSDKSTPPASAPIGQPKKEKKKRFVPTPQQKSILKEQYEVSRYITLEERAALAALTGLTEVWIRRWFINQRAREESSDDES